MKKKRVNALKTTILFAAMIIASVWMPADVDFALWPYSYAIDQTEDIDPMKLKRVLILNSYDEGYSWTKDQSTAISTRLKETYDDILIHVEYMDVKYHPEIGHQTHLYDLYSHKYSDIKIDLILTTDNAALDFASRYRKELFSDAPIVFSGVKKDAAEAILQSQANVVGIFEIIDPAGTIEAASRINPEIEKVYVIHDNTPTGWDSRKQILDDRLQDMYQLYFLNMQPITDIMKTISTLEKNCVVLLCAYSEDVDGYKIPADKFAGLIGESSSVPVYDVWNFRLGNGVLGGSLLSGTTTGNYAAELGAKILDGIPVEQIDNINEKIVEQIYDYRQLERFAIPLELLPEGSSVINKPFSFHEAYKELVVSITIAFVLLLIYILLLMKNIENRKKAEQQAHEANQELSALYEQLYAVDQQLKHELAERSVALEKLKVSEENYRMVAEATNDIIWDLNLEDNLIHHSGGLEKVLGYSDAEFVTEEDLLAIIEKEDLEAVQNELTNAFQNENRTGVCDYRVKHKNGKTVWLHTKVKVLHDEHGLPVKIVGSHTDITELKEYQNKIWELAYYDELTKLPNRAYLKEYINSQIRTGTGSASAIIYLDIDDFKAINDNFGHSEGDELLIKVGNILCEISGENNMIFRQGGDEFVVVFNDVRNRDEISEFVAKLNHELTDPIALTHGAFHITLSGGIVMFPADGENYDTLMKNADIAMYFVKNSGKNGLMFFNLDMMEGAKEKLLLDHHLRSAVKKMDFSIQYQPIIDMETGQICKFEALIRWNHYELGQVPPALFIKHAEENGLIVPIGSWILRESCSFAAELASKGYGNISISVNISPIQLHQKEFVQFVEDILIQTGIAPERIEFEITESVLIDSLEFSLKKLHQIKDLGISISLDDFGQGYSSLTYLRMLPINTLKIDKSFLDADINTDRNGQIICTIIELAHRMQLKVVAEGVETEEQFQFLKDNGCDMIQGYLISKPVSMQETDHLICSYGAYHSPTE